MQAETEADTERTTKQGQRGEIDTCAGQRYHHRQGDQSARQQLAEQNPHRWGQAGQIFQSLLQNPRNQYRYPQRDAEVEHAFQHGQQRQAHLSEIDRQPVEKRQGGIEQAENGECREAIGGDHDRPCPYRLAHEHGEQTDGDPSR